jgi:hypothetical protein
METLPPRPFTSKDLEDLDLTRGRLRALLADGVVRRILQGVYVRCDLPDSVELRAWAARLTMPPHTVVADRSAAWLYGIDCFDPVEHHCRALEVVAIDEHERSRRPELYGGKRALHAEDVCEVNGVLVTSPARTAADLARLRGRHTAIAVLDAFARYHEVTLDDHVRLLRRLKGHRGVIQYRALAPLADPRAESFAESWTRIEILDHGLPPPTPQFWVDLPGFGRVRLDLAYGEWKIAIEYNGEEFHSSAEQRAADDARVQALRAAGWIVLVLTKEDLSRVSGGRWLVELPQLIAERQSLRRRIYSRGESRPRGRRTR